MQTRPHPVSRALKTSVRAAGLVWCLAASQAQATPVPAGSPVSYLLFNFNFGADPAAPYTAMDLFFNVTGLDAGEVLEVGAFDGLDGASLVAGTGIGAPAGTVHIGQLASFSQLTDGVFSIGFRLNQGAADVTNAVIVAVNANGTLTVPGGTVPEPGSLALAGLALAGLAVAQRRRV